jgi:hypothetical protein
LAAYYLIYGGRFFAAPLKYKIYSRALKSDPSLKAKRYQNIKKY